MKKVSCLFTTSLFALSSSAMAMDTWGFPFSDMSFFMGLGTSYNSVKLDQNLIVGSNSNAIANNVIVAFGQAGGAVAPFHQTQTTFAPLVQLGYAWSLPCPDWSGGIKFSYQYINLTASQDNIYLPQSAQLINTPAGANALNANVSVQSLQTMINHQFAILAFIERSYMQSNVYLGVGPSLFGTQFNLNNALAFTDTNGIHNDITGVPVSQSSNKWLWGASLQLGLTKYLDPSWYVDVNYTYSVTQKHSHTHSAPFTTMDIGTGLFSTGSLFANTSQRITTQGVSFSINKEFAV